MTTARNDDPSPPSPEDANISAAVQLLMDQRDETVTDLAYYTRISVASLYRKLGGQAAWKAADIGRVARHFGVSPGDLFAGVGAGEQPVRFPRKRRTQARPAAVAAADKRQRTRPDTLRYRRLSLVA